MGKLKTHFQGRAMMHRDLWLGAEMLYRRGKELEEGSFYQMVAAQLFIFLALEGFLNDLGEVVAPAVWQKEREFFSHGKYRGGLGKLAYIADVSKMDLNKGDRPYQTVKELHRRRNILAHARPETLDGETEVQECGKVEPLRPELWQLGEEGFVAQAFQDVELIADKLINAAKCEYGEFIVTHQRAFRGTHFYGTAWLPTK